METPKPLTAAEWAFVEARRVGRLATVGADGRPHVVPICYATDRRAIYSPLDQKPKRVDARALRRVENLLAHPDVSFLVDDYADDWAQLAYVLVRGRGALIEPGDDSHRSAVARLREKYAPYREMALDERPLIGLEPARASSWSLSPRRLDERAEHPERHLDLMAIVRGRRSVRAFAPDPVPRDLLERVLEAGRWAPSPHGRMPWRFVVITTAAARERLATAMGATWERQLALDGESAAVVADRLARSHERIQDTPVLVLICLYLADLDVYPDAERHRAEETMAIHSLGAAAQNILLAAYDAGLDGGWMCAPLFCGDTVRAALDLAPTLFPHALLTIGYPARDPRRRPHRPLDEIVIAWL